VAVNRRFSHGFNFSLAYTFSKALGTAPGDSNFINPNNPRLYDYRLMDFDRTHAFVATYVYELPKLGSRWGNNAFTRGLLNEWQISGITSLIGGNPFELGVTASGSNVNQRITGSWTEPPRFIVKSDLATGPNGLLIDPNAFIFPALGSIGLGQRNYLRNPGINNTDLSIFKKIPLGDPDKNRYIQLRLEAFNVFNHTQFSGINAGTNLAVPNGRAANGDQLFLTGNAIYARYNEVIISNNIRGQRASDATKPLGAFFGEYNAARDPRILQLAVKIAF
jgi:hypothetical protein